MESHRHSPASYVRNEESCRQMSADTSERLLLNHRQLAHEIFWMHPATRAYLTLKHYLIKTKQSS